MQGRLSMGRNRISDVGLPTSNNDAVNKQYIISNISYLHLFGTVDSSGLFTINGNHQLRLFNISLVMITIFPSSSYNNVGDTLIINQRNRYNFTQARLRRFVNVSINQKFQRITDMQLNKGRNLQFIIVYKTLYI